MSQVLLKDFPIPTPTPAQQAAIEAVVNQILNAKRAAPDADVSALEAEIDQRVYELYGLTPEEIAIVEEAASSDSGN